MHARTSVRMTGKIEHPISIKVLEDKRRREHDGKKGEDLDRVVQ